MITKQEEEQVAAWFTGRLPAPWRVQPLRVDVDREEIIVTVTLDPVELGDDASTDARRSAAEGRLSSWREETRQQRMEIAREAQTRFGRAVSWGASIDDVTALFTHQAVPVMTRLRQPQRQVLDTLVEAGVARSRADALNWCVRLVGQHTEDWLADLRGAMEQVRTVRDRGPA